MTFASVKYFIVKNPKKYKSFAAFKKIYSSKEIAILKNKCYLPLGFSYENYIYKSDFLKLDNKSRQRILLKAIVLDSSEFNFNKINKIQKFDTNQILTGNLCADVKKLKKDTLIIESFRNKKIKGRINLKSDKILFFSIPYDKGWTLFANNKKIKLFRANIGFTAAYLPKGNYNITLRYLPPYFYLTLTISILSILLYLIFLLKPKFKKLDI